MNSPPLQSKIPLVQVLLATFNGARFLREQIDSILAQTYAPLTVLARDDGSTDDTVRILEEYAARLPERFRILPQGSPSGGARFNFLRLLRASTAEFVAFADQDDFWQPDKISISMKAMVRLVQHHGAAVPLLVFTDLCIVDKHLQPLHSSFWANQNIEPSNIGRFSRLLIQNVVTGCTALLNRPLATLAMSMPSAAYMHDWWIALLASSFGKSTFLSSKTVLYRQHDKNVIGAPQRVNGYSAARWKAHNRRRASWESSQQQAAAMLAIHGTALPLRGRELIKAYELCETHPNRLVRTITMIRYRFFPKSLISKLAMLWYLWDMKAAKRQDPSVRPETTP